jgi:uncharacterized membrane protein/thiol-disulfide isomerase/thioredoxin
MRRAPLQIILLLVAICLAAPATAASPPADQPVVRAVLFYSPNCGHCHYVITEVLLPMVEEYGDQLQIVGIDTAQAAGSQLYQATVERYQVPDEQRGVPTLVVHDVVLVGSLEIPNQFPALVEEGLATGGIPWPDIPGLAQLLAESPPQPSPTPASPTAVSPVSTPTATPWLTPTPAPSPTVTSAPVVLAVGEDKIPPAEAQNPSPDPAGFALGGVVLVGMLTALGYAGRRLSRPAVWPQVLHLSAPNRVPVPVLRSAVIPLLCLAGLVIASYLAYVEISHVEAVCGPVGACNVVQTSDYALFLGVPVAVWGVLHYLGVATLWAGQRLLGRRLASLSQAGLLGLTLFGTLFSVYLTCLELFAIHAICAWCLGSAAITTVLMLLVVIPSTDPEYAAGQSLRFSLGETHERS